MKKLMLLVAALLVAPVAQADSLRGSVPLPVSFDGTMGAGIGKVSLGDFHVNWLDWITAAEASGTTIRMCMSFTDAGYGTESITAGVQTHRVGSAYDAWIALGQFGNTWSGLGVWHQKCTPKAPLSSTQDCGSSWQASCTVWAGYNVSTNRAAIPVKIRSVWLEIWR
jgi:hypothetical protein